MAQKEKLDLNKAMQELTQDADKVVSKPTPAPGPSPLPKPAEPAAKPRSNLLDSLLNQAREEADREKAAIERQLEEKKLQAKRDQEEAERQKRERYEAQVQAEAQRRIQAVKRKEEEELRKKQAEEAERKALELAEKKRIQDAKAQKSRLTWLWFTLGGVAIVAGLVLTGVIPVLESTSNPSGPPGPDSMPKPPKFETTKYKVALPPSDGTSLADAPAPRPLPRVFDGPATTIGRSNDKTVLEVPIPQPVDHQVNLAWAPSETQIEELLKAAGIIQGRRVPGGGQNVDTGPFNRDCDCNPVFEDCSKKCKKKGR